MMDTSSCSNVSFDVLADALTGAQDKADILDVNGLAETWQFQLQAGQPPEAGLLAFLRLLNCGGAAPSAPPIPAPCRRGCHHPAGPQLLHVRNSSPASVAVTRHSSQRYSDRQSSPLMSDRVR